jgi:hypothetical protein
MIVVTFTPLTGGLLMARKKSKTLRWTIIIVCVLLFIIVAAVLRFIILNQSAKNELDTTLAEIKQKGYRVDLKNYFPAVPNNKNAWDIWDDAFAEVGNFNGPLWDIVDRGRRGWESLTDAEKNDIRDFINSHQPVLELTQKAVKHQIIPPGFNPLAAAYEWTEPNIFYTSKIYNLMIYCRCMLASEDGDIETIIESLRLGFMISGNLTQYPTSHSYFSGATFFMENLSLIQNLFSGRSVSSETAIKLLDTANLSLLKEHCIETIDVQRICSLNMGRRMLKDFSRPSFKSLEQAKFSFYSFFIRHNLIKALADVQKTVINIIESSQQYYWKIKNDIKKAVVVFKGEDTTITYKTYLMPECDEIFERYAIAEDLTNITRLALACKLYQQDKGVFPNNLKDVVPEYLDTVPLDSFTGKPFVYRQLPEGGFVIYSVGPDEEDDGGPLKSFIDAKSFIENDDFGWREEVNREKERKE